MADTLRTQGMSLLQATHLAADRQLCPPATPIGTSGRKKKKSKSKVSKLLLLLFFNVAKESAVIQEQQLKGNSAFGSAERYIIME